MVDVGSGRPAPLFTCTRRTRGTHVVPSSRMRWIGCHVLPNTAGLFIDFAPELRPRNRWSRNMTMGNSTCRRTPFTSGHYRRFAYRLEGPVLLGERDSLGGPVPRR